MRADSTPVECGRSRETLKRGALTGWMFTGWPGGINMVGQ